MSGFTAGSTHDPVFSAFPRHFVHYKFEEGSPLQVDAIFVILKADLSAS